MNAWQAQSKKQNGNYKNQANIIATEDNMYIHIENRIHGNSNLGKALKMAPYFLPSA